MRAYRNDRLDAPAFIATFALAGIWAVDDEDGGDEATDDGDSSEGDGDGSMAGADVGAGSPVAASTGMVMTASFVETIGSGGEDDGTSFTGGLALTSELDAVGAVVAAVVGVLFLWAC